MWRKFKNLSKLKKILVIIATIILLILCYSFYINVIDVDRTPDPEAKTVTEPAIYNSARTLLDELHSHDDYDDLYSNIMTYDNKHNHMYVLPGINGTKTLNCNVGGVDLCTDMVPQGLVVTDKYIMYTAYCHKGDHNSMLMILDKKTGKFIKEIPLDTKSHVGGIAYDDSHNMVWICEKKNSTPAVAAIPLRSIVAYDSEAMEEPIRHKYEVKLPELKASSFMTYKDATLYIGTFNLSDNGEIHVYHINDDGSLHHPDSKRSWLDKIEQEYITPIFSAFATILPCIQGISFKDEALFMTQSYGPFNSKLLISDDTDIFDGDNKLLDKNIQGEMTFPPYLEYAYYNEDDNKLYFLFEGAAKAYSWRSRVPMDRIISVELD